MPAAPDHHFEGLDREARQSFADLVQSVGIKQFAKAMDLTTRQINRMLSGAQANPVARTIRALQAGQGDISERVLDYICQELGGNFVRREDVHESTVNAIKECAEAIAAISDGQISESGMRDIREAISALSNLIATLHHKRPEMRGE